MNTQHEDKVLDSIEQGLLRYPVFDDYEYDEESDEEPDKELTPEDVERERLLKKLFEGAFE